MTMIKPPQADGLYDPRYEHDACGVAMVAKLDNVPVARCRRPRARRARQPRAPRRRGRRHATPATAPGSSPDARRVLPRRSATSSCRRPAATASASASCRATTALRRKLEQLLELNVRVEGQRVLGWRDVPVDEQHVGDTANRSRPHIRQLFVGAGRRLATDQDAFERKLYVIRRIAELAAGPDFYSPSFSSRTSSTRGC